MGHHHYDHQKVHRMCIFCVSPITVLRDVYFHLQNYTRLLSRMASIFYDVTGRDITEEVIKSNENVLQQQQRPCEKGVEGLVRG